jgi:ribokinase
MSPGGPLDVLVIGSYNHDFCWRAERAPERGETVLGGAFTTAPGGKGFNQAVAAHRQGVATLFLGAIGDDALGEAARRVAGDAGLRAQWLVRAGVSTGAASIVVDANGDNRIVVASGANATLDAAAIEAQKDLIGAARVLLVQLETPLEAVASALELARRRGVRTILNPAPMHAAIDPAALAHVDVLTPNETEFVQLIELAGAGTAREPAALADAQLHELCRAIGVPTLVVTLGAAGAFVSHADPAHCADIAPWYRIAPESVAAIDTTGAGDAFSGALAAALTIHQGRPFRDAVVHANRAAALSTERAGAADAMPTRAELEARFG